MKQSNPSSELTAAIARAQAAHDDATRCESISTTVRLDDLTILINAATNMISNESAPAESVDRHDNQTNASTSVETWLQTAIDIHDDEAGKSNNPVHWTNQARLSLKAAKTARGESRGNV